MQDDQLQAQRDEVMEYLIGHADFEHWTEKSFRRKNENSLLVCVTEKEVHVISTLLNKKVSFQEFIETFV